MYEKLEKCPVCKNTQFTNTIICQDHSVSQESFALVQCTKCELLFTNPRPEEQQLASYYESENYISHTNNANTLINKLYKVVRNITLKQKIGIIKNYQSSGTLLDYGAGTGHFLATANKNGYQTFGFEPDEKAARIAASQSTSTMVSDLQDIPQPLDIITTWHVAEHIPTLLPTLKSLKKKLSSNGLLFIAVPNYASFDAQHYREHWAAYDVPRHLYHFTRTSLSHLAKKLKMHVIDTLPMKFDAYYVSMLSEQNKCGKNNFVRAFKVGWQSNHKAQTTGEYSSLIYVLAKDNKS